MRKEIETGMGLILFLLVIFGLSKFSFWVSNGEAWGFMLGIGMFIVLGTVISIIHHDILTGIIPHPMTNSLDILVYEKIARKELDLGCFISYKENETSEEKNAQWNCGAGMDISYGDLYFDNLNIGSDVKIYGNPIILSDVIEFIYENAPEDTVEGRIYSIIGYWDTSKPYLQDQSQECIEYVHSLILKK